MHEPPAGAEALACLLTQWGGRGDLDEGAEPQTAAANPPARAEVLANKEHSGEYKGLLKQKSDTPLQ